MYLVLLLNILSSYLISSIFSNLFIFYIVLFSLIILNSEILSLLNFFNPTGVTIVSVIGFIISLIFFLKSEKKLYFPDIREELNKIKNALKLDKSLLIVGLCFIFLLICYGFLSNLLIFFEDDTRMYHFARVLSYVHNQNFLHFLTHQSRNLVMPINSEIIYSYVYMFKKNDVGFGFLSYFSYIFAIFGIWEIFSYLKISIRKRLFSIFVLTACSPVCVQIPSIQTDIVVASLAIASIALFMKAQETNKNLWLYFSSLSYSLALGLKTTSIIIFPSVLLILISYTFLYKKKNKRETFVKFFSFLILNFLIFSSYNYILNCIDFKNPLTTPTLKLEHIVVGGYKEMFFNGVILSGDFFGYHIGVLYYVNLVIQKIIFNFFHIPQFYEKTLAYGMYDERLVGFTHLGFYFIGCLIYSILLFFKKSNKASKLIAVFSLAFFINFLIIATQFQYSVFVVRYFATFAILSSFCFIYGYKNKIIKFLIAVICGINLIFYGLFSTFCPLVNYFGHNILDKNALKEYILLNKFKGKRVEVYYSAYKYIVDNFKKTDKIAIVDSIQTYEVKAIINFGYNAQMITLKNLLDKDYIKQFDYVVVPKLTIINVPKLLINDDNFYCMGFLKKNNKKDAISNEFCWLEKFNYFYQNNFKLMKKFELKNNDDESDTGIYIFKKEN